MFITDATIGFLTFPIVEGSKLHRKSVCSNIVCHVACVGEIKKTRKRHVLGSRHPRHLFVSS